MRKQIKFAVECVAVALSAFLMLASFGMDAKKLKKLIGKAEKLGRLWYMAYMEERLCEEEEKEVDE